MKKIIASGVFVCASVFGQVAMAQDPIVGFDVLGLGNGQSNFYYQDRAFNNSAFRIGAASSGGSMSLDLGFRFYFADYANGPYVQGDMLLGSGNGTRMQIGVDLPMGNLVLDPHFWSGSGNSGAGLNLGFRF